MSEFKNQMIARVSHYLEETNEKDIKFTTLMPMITNLYLDLKSNRRILRIRKKTKITKRMSLFKRQFLEKMSKLLDEENDMYDFIGALTDIYFQLNKKK